MEDAIKLIERLNRNSKKLSKGQRRIAECIVAHYEKVAFMTAARLAEYAGVSESTVIRFAFALGYDGFPQLKKALQELVNQRLTAHQRLEMNSDMDHTQVLTKVLRADIGNIRSTLDELDLKAFEDSIELILSSRHIYVLGLRASAPLAQFLAHYLNYISPQVILVTSGVSDIFEQLNRIGPGDLLIGISFPRYTNRTIEAMQFARKREASLIAITDGPLSPLHSTADLCLTARCDMISFVDSLAAPISLINALIVAIGQRRHTDVAGFLSQMEEAWDEYNVYLPSAAPTREIPPRPSIPD